VSWFLVGRNVAAFYAFGGRTDLAESYTMAPDLVARGGPRMRPGGRSVHSDHGCGIRLASYSAFGFQFSASIAGYTLRPAAGALMAKHPMSAGRNRSRCLLTVN